MSFIEMLRIWLLGLRPEDVREDHEEYLEDYHGAFRDMVPADLDTDEDELLG